MGWAKSIKNRIRSLIIRRDYLSTKLRSLNFPEGAMLQELVAMDWALHVVIAAANHVRQPTPETEEQLIKAVKDEEEEWKSSSSQKRTEGT